MSDQELTPRFGRDVGSSLKRRAQSKQLLKNTSKESTDMNKLLLLGLASGLMACGGGSKGDSMQSANPCGDNPCGANPCGDNPCGDNPCGDNPCGGGDSAGGPMDVGVDWSGWATWSKVNAEPFVSKGHKKPWVNVYVPPEQVSTYAALEGEMPEGFAIVKSVHKDADGVAGDVAALTVMVKMGSDYDPDNGNWYYGVLSADGSKAMNEGKIGACIGCHSSADTDYLFGTK